MSLDDFVTSQFMKIMPGIIGEVEPLETPLEQVLKAMADRKREKEEEALKAVNKNNLNI